MKLNKKGFMLAEVVIVASVIAGILITLYISLNRVAAAYDKRNRYYDIDAMYVAMEINDILIDDGSLDYYANSNYVDLLHNQENQGVDFFGEFYDSESGYLLREVYYIRANEQSLNDLNNFTSDVYLKDYTSYLKDNIEFNDYDYLILVEIEKANEDDIYFYTLKVGDTNES